MLVNSQRSWTMFRTLMIPLQRRTLRMEMCHVILTSCHRDVIINLVLMVVVLENNVISIIFVRRVTLDAGYVMTITKRVPIMDIINGLKKRIIPEQ